jgi:dihydroorotase
VDMNRRRILDNRQVVSKCGWTPYHGREITGDIVLTMVRGKVVMKDGAILAEPGWGKWVTRKELPKTG